MPSITLSSSDLLEILTFTTELARRAGDLILAGSQAILSSGNVDEKKNSVDLVTEYDVKVEELVKGELGRKYRGFKLCVLPLPPSWITTCVRVLAVLAVHREHTCSDAFALEGA